MLILAMDANFCLKSWIRNSTKTEPMLGTGMSYFVDNVVYGDFIKNYVDEVEVCWAILRFELSIRCLRGELQISNCVGFQALLNMLTKKSKGLRATGMAAVSCAHHQMFRPLGLGDLQKGERYIPIMVSSLSFC